MNYVSCAIEDICAYDVRNLRGMWNRFIVVLYEMYRTVELQVEVVPY